MPPAKKKSKNERVSVASNANTITTKIVAEFKDRQRAQIQKWRQSLTMATDPDNQRLYALEDLCDNLEADGHYISQVELRKAATLGREFSIIDRRTGKEQPEKTAFFYRQWFYDLMDDILNFIPRGRKLLELVDPAGPRFIAIPNRNVVPFKRQILLSVQDDKGIDYTPFLGHTLIQVGNADDLGLMANLCGQLIWKRNAQQSWAEYSERFGFPLITATTNKSSDAEIARIRQMLAALGEAAQAVLPEGTTIDIKAANSGDAYQVYDKQIERINSEVSKALIGGTMVSDDGSSRSQSEVHERNLDDKIAARDRRIVTFVTNDQVIPMLAMWGHPFDPENDLFQFNQTFDLTVREHWDIVAQAGNIYNIPPDWVSKTFNFPIEDVKPKQLAARNESKEEDETATANAPKDSFTANFQ